MIKEDDDPQDAQNLEELQNIMTTFGSPDQVRENAHELLELLERYVEADKCTYDVSDDKLHKEATRLIDKINGRNVPKEEPGGPLLGRP